MTIWVRWARHRELAAVYCRVRSVDDSAYQSHCDGRWNVADLDQFELHDAPPDEQRCNACVKRMGAE